MSAEMTCLKCGAAKSGDLDDVLEWDKAHRVLCTEVVGEYTPTTEDVRRAASDYRAPITPEEFDRWLAAHDAEVRAGVVSEEPEWEYGIDYEGDGAVERYGERAYAAQATAEQFDAIFMRRRKHGAWEPVAP